MASKRAKQEIFNRGLSASNNHHHGSAYRDQKRQEKKALNLEAVSPVEFAPGLSLALQMNNDNKTEDK